MGFVYNITGALMYYFLGEVTFPSLPSLKFSFTVNSLILCNLNYLFLPISAVPKLLLNITVGLGSVCLHTGRAAGGVLKVLL